MTFQEQKEAILKAKFDEHETNSTIKKIRACIGALVTLRRVTSLEII